MATFSYMTPTATACHSTSLKRPRTVAQAPACHETGPCRRDARWSFVGSTLQHDSLSPERHSRDHRGDGPFLWIDVANQILGWPCQHAADDSPQPILSPKICDVLGRTAGGSVCSQSRHHSGIC